MLDATELGLIIGAAQLAVSVLAIVIMQRADKPEIIDEKEAPKE